MHYGQGGTGHSRSGNDYCCSPGDALFVVFGCSDGLAGQNHLIVLNLSVQIHILMREAMRIK